MDKYLKTLELDKILEMLAELTSNEETRKMALSLEPDNDLERVRYECLKTSQALDPVCTVRNTAVQQFQGRYRHRSPCKVRSSNISP